MSDNINYLQDISHKLLRDSGLDVQIQLKDYFPERRLIGGKYSLETNQVTIYVEEVRTQCVKLIGSEEQFLDFFTVILAHELGHAADSNLPILASKRAHTECLEMKKQVSILIENNAWNYAYNLVPQFKDILALLKEHSMKLYK
ncbi:hypothetical protein IQ283_07505 [Alkalihalobacillus hwajinpoensis]|uniref:hypothetical protein n=1 Tax=Guptibacillus hwajinpoensis TaxID=208199 RepID=UPI0018831D7D|nr:hypothetical protein [Pseudalkalibacillus hwajinpoensis]MBF0706455.1 hypothetical protein [Pseudalkalibacillus hwajinpoensis]